MNWPFFGLVCRGHSWMSSQKRKARNFLKSKEDQGLGVSEMASAKNGVRNRCPYRRCGVDAEIPYRLPLWREFCWLLPVRVASGVDTEFPYRVRIVDRIAISAATYRGAKCPTLKTAEKQPKKAPRGWQYNNRKTAGETAETPEKQLFWLFCGCFCFSGCFSAVWPGPTLHLFRLFFGCFQCRAFGTSVAGRRDCNDRGVACRHPVCRHHFRFPEPPG